MIFSEVEQLSYKDKKVITIGIVSELPAYQNEKFVIMKNENYYFQSVQKEALENIPS